MDSANSMYLRVDPMSQREDAPITQRRIGKSVVTVLILLASWIVWNESAELKVIIEGLVFAVVSLVVTDRYLLNGSYGERFRFSPRTIVRYIAVVFVEIYKAGFHAIRLTLTDRLNLGIVEIETDAGDDIRGTFIANAITLTPGTVTIDYDDGRLKVIWMDIRTDDPKVAGEMIKGSFERIFSDSVAPVSSAKGDKPE